MMTDQWTARSSWFDALAEPPRAAGYLLSEHACALLDDVHKAFCAGAWASVIIVSVAVIEAHLRDVEFPGERMNLATLLDAASHDPRFQRLRQQRNRLVHFDSRAPALSVESDLEDQAREAVRLAFEMIWANPCV